MNSSIISLLLFTTLVFFIIYYVFVLRLYKVWNSGSTISDTSPGHNSLSVSIVISGRNESKNLKNCIASIMHNDYPEADFEVIYIDDHSEDNSVGLLKALDFKNFRFFELNDYLIEKPINSYKKAALNLGISSAKGQIILFTDADTVVGKKWIQSHVEQYNIDKTVKMCTAPVIYINGNHLIENFQYYDLMATMGFTYGGIAGKSYFMANGANMSFLKEIYDPTAANPCFASGDDMFFIQIIARRYPESIRFIKSEKASVFTYPEKTITSLLAQRIRWGTKSTEYSDIGLKVILAIVFITNLLIITDIVVFGTVNGEYLIIFLVLLGFKIIADIFFIRSVAITLNQKVGYLSLIVSLVIYPFYIVPMGILSLLVTKYMWKGRKVK